MARPVQQLHHSRVAPRLFSRIDVGVMASSAGEIICQMKMHRQLPESTETNQPAWLPLTIIHTPPATKAAEPASTALWLRRGLLSTSGCPLNAARVSGLTARSLAEGAMHGNLVAHAAGIWKR